MATSKIVCTIGPAVHSPESIRTMIQAGMDVARLNMSHGTHEDHADACRWVREAAKATGHGVAVFADLQGPKIRLQTFANGPVWLEAGGAFTITTRDVAGDATICGTTYAGLPGDVTRGDQVLVDDGKIRLRVIEVTATDVHTEVVVGGAVSDHKGINLPGVAVSVPALSEKDEVDLRWALRQSVDFVALSFVRQASDVERAREIMREEKLLLPVIAKIEKPQAIDNLDEIVDTFDAIMVARGDLGVEMPLEQVPLLQKRVVEKARRNAKPVIVATQMLESMIANPAPTRAEASDVANAVLDGADAVMLSGETSVGRYPLEAVRTMSRIVDQVEQYDPHRMAAITWQPRTRGGIIAKAAAEVAERVGARFLIAFTQSGDSARRLARYRGRVPILAFTPEEKVCDQLSLTWGVRALLTDPVEHTDEMVRQVDEQLLQLGDAEEGDVVVIIAGSPPGIPGSTNALRIHRMGDAINEVAPAYRRLA